MKKESELKVSLSADLEKTLATSFVNTIARKMASELDKMKTHIKDKLNYHYRYVQAVHDQLLDYNIADGALEGRIANLKAARNDIDHECKEAAKCLQDARAIRREMLMITMDEWEHANTLIKQYIDKEIKLAILNANKDKP